MASNRCTLAFTAPKTQYATNGTYSNSRAIVNRTSIFPLPFIPGSLPVPIPHKTQNRDGGGGRLRRIKAKAVAGDCYRNGVIPHSGGADPNVVLSALAYTRGQGSVAPPKAGANNVS